MAAGAVKVYREKVSGAKANRAELMKVVNKLEPGDVLVVISVGRATRTCVACTPHPESFIRRNERVPEFGRAPRQHSPLLTSGGPPWAKSWFSSRLEPRS
jgi:hypothetical protein